MSEQSEITFRSDVTVELVKHAASDADVLFAARVSTQGERSLDSVEADTAGAEGLIRFLMRERHGSPFEHSVMTFYVQAPIFVWREHMRHRIASYNEESGRYKVLEPVFYVPDEDRKLVQVGKAGAYEFIDGTPDQFACVREQTEAACRAAYGAYQTMLEAGVAREVARLVAPLVVPETGEAITLSGLLAVPVGALTLKVRVDLPPLSAMRKSSVAGVAVQPAGRSSCRVPAVLARFAVSSMVTGLVPPGEKTLVRVGKWTMTGGMTSRCRRRVGPVVAVPFW